MPLYNTTTTRSMVRAIIDTKHPIEMRTVMAHDDNHRYVKVYDRVGLYNKLVRKFGKANVKRVSRSNALCDAIMVLCTIDQPSDCSAQAELLSVQGVL